MVENRVNSNIRPEFDQELKTIASYVMHYSINSQKAYDTARWCLMDALGCAIFALNFSACTKLLGPIVEGTQVKHGARVPGTNYILDPVQAAFNIGTMIRWLDFNDTWLAAEWGHPSDNLGGILAVADYTSRLNQSQNKASLTMKEVFQAMIMAYEIQGIMALENSFNRVGLDHVVLVKVATTAVVAKMLGANEQQILNALSLAWIDGQSLRTYRQAPNTGSRKSWAAGDASSRGVYLSMIAMKGEMGYPSALSAPVWGFYDVSFQGQSFRLQRDYSSYVMENILFKIAYPAEFHAQTAVEAAVILHPQVKNRWHEIEKIVITTHESAIRIISKQGALYNPPDRDHCLQYMVAIALLSGNLKASDYENQRAQDPKIDPLRNTMQVIENQQYSHDYHDPNKRSIANAVQIFFKDGSFTEKVAVEYPIGHPRRRKEGLPLLEQKMKTHLKSQLSAHQIEQIWQAFCHPKLEDQPVHQLIDLFVR